METNWFQSRTLNWAFIIAVLGAVQIALPAVREFIPPDAYGVIFGLVGALMAYLRLTYKPVEGEKR